MILQGTVKGKKKEELDRRRAAKIILKSGQELTRAAENRTRWKGIVVMSSVVPRRPCKVTWDRIRKIYAYFEQCSNATIMTLYIETV